MPAISLSSDVALVTSLANDFDYTEVFARQVEVLGQPGDVLIGLSTSGSSPNVLRALEAGKARGLLTVALTGKGGGGCAQVADFVFAVRSHNILRIQECHLTLYHILWDMVHTLLHFDPAFRGLHLEEAGRAQPREAPPGESHAPANSEEGLPSAGPAPVEGGDAAPVDPALAELYPFLFQK